MESNALREPHRQWANRPADQRFESLADLKTSVDMRRRNSIAYPIALADLRTVGFESSGGLYLAAPRRDRVPMSNWAFGQLAQRMGAPSAFLRKLPSTLAAEVVNDRLRATAARADDDERKATMLVTTDDEGENGMVRAATSDTYGRIWDAEVVSLVSRIVDASDGRFVNPLEWSGKRAGLYASDRDVFCFFVDGGSIVDGGGSRDQLNRGFFVSNSEVGKATLWISTFLFRQVCGNHQIWGGQDVKELKIRHTSGAPGRFMQEALPTLLSYVNASAKPLEDQVHRAKSYAIPGQSDVERATWIKAQGFTGAEVKGATAYATREEGSEPHTLWLLVQGLTAYARDMAYVDARVDLEQRAGKLMRLAA